MIAVLQALAGSVALVLAGLALGVPVGAAVAVALSAWAKPSGGVATALRVLHAIPPAVVAVGVAVALGGLGLSYPVLVALSFAVWTVPVVAVAAEVRLRRVPARVKLAAYALGADRAQLAISVLLPRAWPAVAESSLRVGARLLAELPALLVLGAISLAPGPATLPLLGMRSLTDEPGLVVAVSALLAGYALCLHMLADRVARSPRRLSIPVEGE